jgi:hypothetical protein
MPRRAIRLAALLLLAGCAEAPGPQSYKPDCDHQADQAEGRNLAVSCIVVNNYTIGGTATASPPITVTPPSTLPVCRCLPCHISRLRSMPHRH